jgi:hypothetical protein
MVVHSIPVAIPYKVRTQLRCKQDQQEGISKPRGAMKDLSIVNPDSAKL